MQKVAHTVDNGSEICDTAKDVPHGRMELTTKAIGSRANAKAMARCGTQMEAAMRDSGRIISAMALATTRWPSVTFTKVNSRTTR